MTPKSLVCLTSVITSYRAQVWYASPCPSPLKEVDSSVIQFGSEERNYSVSANCNRSENIRSVVQLFKSIASAAAVCHHDHVPKSFHTQKSDLRLEKNQMHWTLSIHISTHRKTENGSGMLAFKGPSFPSTPYFNSHSRPLAFHYRLSGQSAMCFNNNKKRLKG